MQLKKNVLWEVVGVSHEPERHVVAIAVETHAEPSRVNRYIRPDPAHTGVRPGDRLMSDGTIS